MREIKGIEDLKVGDKVWVKNDLVGGERYGGLSFAEEMEHYKGKEVVITEIDGKEIGFYSDYDGFGWWLNTEMIDWDKTKEANKVENVGIYADGIPNIINFAKIDLTSDAVIPSKEHYNAGYDIYANFEEENFIIQPHETRMISTGIASAISDKYYFQLFERGSTGTKGIGQRCGVIDSSYRGEWFVPITNLNTKPLVITKEISESALDALREDFIVYPYHKAICQAVVLEVPKMDVVEIPYSELLQIHTHRGSGMLGSSGK